MVGGGILGLSEVFAMQRGWFATKHRASGGNGAQCAPQFEIHGVHVAYCDSCFQASSLAKYEVAYCSVELQNRRQSAPKGTLDGA